MVEFVYAGSFDPVTPGHIDVALRAAKDCEHLTVLVAHNICKRQRYEVAARLKVLRKVFANQPNIDVDACHGCVAWWAVDHGAVRLVRGLRGWCDWMVEVPLAFVNAVLGWGLLTRFYHARPSMKHVSSTSMFENMGRVCQARVGGSMHASHAGVPPQPSHGTR